MIGEVEVEKIRSVRTSMMGKRGVKSEVFRKQRKPCTIPKNMVIRNHVRQVEKTTTTSGSVGSSGRVYGDRNPLKTRRTDMSLSINVSINMKTL